MDVEEAVESVGTVAVASVVRVAEEAVETFGTVLVAGVVEGARPRHRAYRHLQHPCLLVVEKRCINLLAQTFCTLESILLQILEISFD